MSHPKSVSSTTTDNNSYSNQDDEREVMSILGSLFQEAEAQVPSEANEINAESSISKNPMFVMGLAGAFVLAHGAIILSLPPVLMGKGAPFVPSTKENMNRMFKLIKMQDQIKKNLKQKKLMKFIDLGSGDGRMVFQSAREPDLFKLSVGYEINPVLHMFALTRRLVQYKSYYYNTSFQRQDLWKVNLKDADVIAVYGLFNVMDRLGVKIEKEAKPGTIIVSNVFAIPGWTPISVENGVYLYSIPESLR